VDKDRTIGKIFLTPEEGMIRNAMGDHVLNKWGYRGPYFEKKTPKNVYRIAIAGASTTAGQYDNELTYPRILERMLNKKSNIDKPYEVINAGHYWYNACDVREIVKRELLSFKPNLILVMSGWNDLNRIRNDAYQTKEQYCDNHFSFFDRFKLKLLLNIALQKYLPKNSSSPPYLNVYKINKKSFSLFEENFHKLIKITKNAGVDLGLISLTGVLERNQTMESIDALPQLALHNSKMKQYSQKVLIQVDNLYRRLAKENSNVFYINTGSSINSRGKELFFNDQLHGTGAGNRVHAYGIYKSLNNRLKIHDFGEAPLDENGLDPNEVEIEYLKGLFATNKIEDLSYSACMVFHENCTHRDREQYHKINESLLNAPGYPDREFVTSVIEFVFGSMLQFSDETAKPEILKILEQKLNLIIEMRPKLSLSHWVLGQLYNLSGKTDLASKYLSKAYQLNPKLKEINYVEFYARYQENRIENPLLEINGLLHFINVIKKSPNYIAPYSYQKMLKSAVSPEAKRKLIGLFENLYFTSPLLLRSIIIKVAEWHVELNQRKQAEKILEIFKMLKPSFKDSINQFQKELLLEK
jgi:lysophospholipase L1-like esterase